MCTSNWNDLSTFLYPAPTGGVMRRTSLVTLYAYLYFEKSFKVRLSKSSDPISSRTFLITFGYFPRNIRQEHIALEVVSWLANISSTIDSHVLNRQFSSSSRRRKSKALTPFLSSTGIFCNFWIFSEILWINCLFALSA